MKFVLDTNQLVSALIVPHGYPAVILNKWGEDDSNILNLILSNFILGELLDVLHRQRIFKKYHLTEDNIQNYVGYLKDFAVLTSLNNLEDLQVVKDDPDDNMILATALAGEADFIVSGDKHLLDLGEYKAIKILTAVEFIKILEGGILF